MMTSKPKGVALIQVLLMIAIMSLIAIQFSKTARVQVETANDFKNRLQSEMALRTARSRLIYQFFKSDPGDISDARIDGVKWNFRSKVFNITENVEVKIQAQSGLLSLTTSPPQMILRVLTANGASAADAQEIVASIGDWVDTDNYVSNFGAESEFYRLSGHTGTRNGPLQDISELAVIKGMTEPLYNRTKDYFTIYNLPSFNPALAPPELVRALFSSERSEKIVQAQQDGNFTEDVWRNIIGRTELAFIDVHPRALFSVELTSKFEDVRLTKRLDFLVQTHMQRDPIVILSSY